MAAVRVSGYVPLRSGLTSYSDWLSLNCLTSSLVASPSWPVMACQNWISVLAEAGDGARATRTERATAPVIDRQIVVVRGMAVLLVGNGSETPVMLPSPRLARGCGLVTFAHRRAKRVGL